MPKLKKVKQSHVANPKTSSGDWHVSHTSLGMGDYYGTGVRQPLGKMRRGVGMIEITPKKLKEPPTSVA